MTSSRLRHTMLVCGGFTLLFTWLYAKPIVEHSLLAESDLYEYFLPVFLAPATVWSSFEFGGAPAFADPLDMAFYPLRTLFAVAGSWTALIVSAFILAACFVYAYVYSITQSRTAAAFAGVAFGVSEAMMERLAHLTTIHATAWIPLILLSVDRLRGPRPLAWVAIGAFAVGNCILGGHPQIVVYAVYVCGVYALVGGLAERADWRYYIRLVSMAAIGVLLTAIKTLPVLETSEVTARQSLNFEAFVSHANSAAQMLSMLMPAIEHEGREAPTYVGIATLIFAITAALRPLRSWRVSFWLVVAVVSLMLGAGDATPLAQLAYHVPLYDRFRVEARHLIFAGLGLSILAGFAVAALQAGEVTWRRVLAASALVAIGIGMTTAALSLSPSTFPLDSERVLPWSLPIWDSAIWIQLGIAVASIVACVALACRPRDTWRAVALITVLGVDLVLALPYDIEATGLDETTIPAVAAAQPGVHAKALAAQLEPQHQRLLAPTGTQLDDVVPAAFARTWRIPIAGGYGPMLLARYADLARMGTNGSVDPLVMADDNTALDLLAVKYVVMKEDDLKPRERSERNGLEWSSHTLNMTVGRPDCGQRYPRTVSYALAPGAATAGVAIVTRLRCSEDVPQGTEVAKLRILGAQGERHEWPLRAGIETADAGLTGDLRQRAKHAPATVFDTEDDALDYVAMFALPTPMPAERMEIEVTTAGWLDVMKLSLLDAADHATPQEVPALLFNPDRWRESARFATSRSTDRGAYETDGNETSYVVFENRRALPRAWVAHQVMPLGEKDTLNAIHYSQLPDGRRFDPVNMALLADGGAPKSYPAGESSVAVRSVGDGTITIDVTTAGGGFLVLSEAFYQGWQARIGDQLLPVARVDHALQGVEMPAGRHTVEFEMVSPMRRTGAVVSLIALVALGVIAWRGFLAA